MRQEEAEELQKKIMSAKFNFNDFLKQTKAIAQMGSFSRVIGMIPGMNKVQLWILGLICYISLKLVFWTSVVAIMIKDLKRTSLRPPFLPCFEQVTPAQIREAEKNFKFMESMINVMTAGMYNLHSVDIMKIQFGMFFPNLLFREIVLSFFKCYCRPWITFWGQFWLILIYELNSWPYTHHFLLALL